jgi:Zinc knuckle
MMMAIMQATKGNDNNQIDTSMMLCYSCGQYGHRSNECKNAKNFELAAQVLKVQGWSPCEHCRRFGHPLALCWNLPENVQTRPAYWKGLRKQEYNSGPHTGVHESGNMYINQDSEEDLCELSLVMGYMQDKDMKSIDELLKEMGLNLSNPDVWIGDTGATTHNTSCKKNTINHHKATDQDNIIGVTGVPAWL